MCVDKRARSVLPKAVRLIKKVSVVAHFSGCWLFEPAGPTLNDSLLYVCEIMEPEGALEPPCSEPTYGSYLPFQPLGWASFCCTPALLAVLCDFYEF